MYRTRSHYSSSRKGLVSLWHNRLVAPGTNWSQAIDMHLETASLILLLISADFLASDYSFGIEVRRALERQEAHQARVVPILLRPVDWKDTPFAHLQLLPTNARPVTSWRNRDAAWADVTAGIRRVIEDLPLLKSSAPRAVLPIGWNIPYPRNTFFLGREELFLRIRMSLQTRKTTTFSQPQAITGLGGIGMTQIAVEYAYRFHQEYKAVLWTHAESEDALIASYGELADLLALPERNGRDARIMVQAVKRWLQQHEDWLLIIDSVDNMSLLLDFLLPAPQGDILLTTRAWDVQRLAQRIDVGPLLEKQGASFF